MLKHTMYINMCSVNVSGLYDYFNWIKTKLIFTEIDFFSLWKQNLNKIANLKHIFNTTENEILVDVNIIVFIQI